MTNIIDNIVRLDFETRSPVDLKKHGAWIYSKHPETVILCMAYQIPGEENPIWTPNLSDKRPVMPIMLHIMVESYGHPRFEAHNAFFEQCIWQNICVERWDWPELPPERWQCSASLAALHALPRSLDGVSRALK